MWSDYGSVCNGHWVNVSNVAASWPWSVFSGRKTHVMELGESCRPSQESGVVFNPPEHLFL